MTIPASQLVDITPNVIGGGLSGLAFVGTFLSKSASLPAATAVPFYSLSAVGDYFGTSSKEYELAGNYFTADSNASKKPDVLWFYKKVDGDEKAWIRGVSPKSLGVLQEVTNGGFSIKINGTKQDVAGLDISALTSYSEIAAEISSQLSDATCSWNSNFKAFVIATTDDGSTVSIEFAKSPASGTDLSEMLGLTSGTISQGAVATSLTLTMEGLVDSNSNFWSFMPVWDESSVEALELAEWCNNQGVRFMYALVDKSNDPLTPNNAACLAKQVADFYGVCCVYNTKNLGAMIMGIGASINPQQLNGRKTWAYKQQNGLAYTADDETTSQTLLDNGYNFYGNYATASNLFKLLQNGQISGNAKWIDTYYGQLFIKDGLQNAWLNALMQNNTVPYNQSGYSVLRAAAMDIINTAVNAGFIRQGVSLSESQKATTQAQAGLDISGALETQGWYLQILDPTTAVRAERGTPIVNFWYMDGGSVQLIQGTSTVLL